MKSIMPELRRPAIREAVCDAIRTSLLAGEFKPGEAISEPELASQLGVSRGPVREALLILTEEGLVTHAQNRGFFINQSREEDDELIMRVRSPLEIIALTDARKHVTEADLVELEHVRDQLLEAMERSDYKRAVRMDLTFHMKVCELSRNPWLVTALRRILVPFFTFNMIYRTAPPSMTLADMQMEHNLYINYLRGTTPKSAEECVRFHRILSPLNRE